MATSSRGTLNEKGRPVPEGGFTLLEIVIVVAVLALLVGLTVPTLPDIAGTRTQQNARKVSMMLQVARNRAVSLRRYYRVEVDLGAGSLSLSYFGPEGTYIPDDEVREFTVKEGEITDVVSSTDGKVLEGTAMIRISPRGFTEPALIHLKGRHEQVITVAPSPVSGRVWIHEGYTDLLAE